MRYVVIDDFNESINLSVDEEGYTKVFEDFSKAKKEANDCQNGIVVSLGEQKYTEEQVLDLILSMEMALNPESYKSTQGLAPEDFLDLAVCKAEELGLTEEFKLFRKINDNCIE